MALIKLSVLFLFAVLASCSAVPENSVQSVADSRAFEKREIAGVYGKEDRFKGLEWRFVGPMRGGRANAVVGHPTNPFVFYAGYTGGGVWKTSDGGLTWNNLSDGQFGVGSVGALAISESQPDTLYAGTGEHALRGDISHGDGVYKSQDGGNSWQHVGLGDTRQIAEILVHPQNPDIVYVAALGAFTGPTEQRGVFKSEDGGKTWTRTLYISPDAGVIEIELSRNDPDLMFAATWDVRRFPWGIRSAGPDSRIFRSRDGGDTWADISDRPGLPSGMKEKIGLGLSDAKPGRIWALVSAESGRGVYLSDDYGESWARTASEKQLLARTFYFNHMTADPQDTDTVYVLNDRLWRSEDAGKTFEQLPHNHADHHDLWIDPTDNSRMIDATDGGAEISFNGGKTWSSLFNQPTAQFYTLTLDNETPYNLYGAQQDWSTIAVPSRHRGIRGSTGFYDTGYSEAGRVAIDQRDPDVLYISDHHWLLKYNKRGGGVQYVGPRDETNYGWGTADIKYRFNWTFPVLTSAHDDQAIYAASQFLHQSRDGGQTWREISPDLTRADPDKLEQTPLPGKEGASNPEYWGPLTRDSNGDHWFSTIYTVAESPISQGEIWTGSDDGFVQLTRNNGETWTNVTPPEMPRYAMITRIEPSPIAHGTAYVTASEYKLNNYETQVYRTTNFGETWQRIVQGLPPQEIMRAIVSDPARRGLLYAGGETGVYISHDNGNSWENIRLNLPAVPIYDMRVRGDDLVIATHGRGFWILDDLSVFRQESTHIHEKTKLYQPAPVRRWSGRWARSGNAPEGLVVRYRLAEDATSISIKITDANDRLVTQFSSKDSDTLSIEKGLRYFHWNLRYPNAQRIDGVVTRGNQEVGPRAVPGRYTVSLHVDGSVFQAPFIIERDPRITATDLDLQRQFDFLSAIRDLLDQMNKGIIGVRSINTQIDDLSEKNNLDAFLRAELENFKTALERIERELVQVNAKARKDLHANPVALNDKLYRLSNFASRADVAPTPTQLQMYEEFSAAIRELLISLESLFAEDLGRLNDALTNGSYPVLVLPVEHGPAGEEVSAQMPR